jgi:hypothetical protein
MKARLRAPLPASLVVVERITSPGRVGNRLNMASDPSLFYETGCAQCHRLWQTLAEAAGAYVKIIRDHKAIPARDRPAALPIELKAAARVRRQARKALWSHEAMHRKISAMLIDDPAHPVFRPSLRRRLSAVKLS